MEPGWNWAIAQLKHLEIVSEGRFEIVQFESFGDGDYLGIEVSLSTSHIKTTEGIQLNARERFLICLANDFPLSHPWVRVDHDRFAGLPHVQKRKQICLYRSVATEWNPSAGIYGVIERIEHWLTRAASGTLVPAIGPVHPPIAYRSRKAKDALIIREPAPVTNGTPWIGLTRLSEKLHDRVDLVGWVETENTNQIESAEFAGAAVLLSTAMPFEYPGSFGGLLDCLEPSGITSEMLFGIISSAATFNKGNAPTYVIIGTPMRRKESEMVQHLEAWYIDQGTTTALKSHLKDERTDKEMLVASLRDKSLSWCSVIDARPEVSIRRDSGSPMNWFTGKSICILGAGSVGATVSECIARAGASKLVVFDHGLVTPGLLVRQPYSKPDEGAAKSHMLKARLERCCHGLKVEAYTENILHVDLEDKNRLKDCALVIDTTGNNAILAKLELDKRAGKLSALPMVSLGLSHDASAGMLVLARANYSGGLLDASRKTKLALANSLGRESVLETFWPENDSDRLFEPEPGCSEPTYRGAYADVLSLTGSMAKMLAIDLARAKDTFASSHLIFQPECLDRGMQDLRCSFDIDSDLRIVAAGYEVRIAPAAKRGMAYWMKRSSRLSGPNVETGGALFGEFDHAARIIWVTEVSGPPPDSTASEHRFICGKEGLQVEHEEKSKRYRGSVYFIGLWHSHPDGPALPSQTDLTGMLDLLYESDKYRTEALMLIVGREESYCCGLFQREPESGTWVQLGAS